MVTNQLLQKSTSKQFARKDFADLFGKICILLQMAYREHFAKPDKRSMSEEGGYK